MMNTDRFKFRVWDKKEERYIVNEDIAIIQTGEAFCFADFSDEIGNMLDDERYLIEQCTGVRDMITEPIFENDVVKYGKNIYCIKYIGCSWLLTCFGEAKIKLEDVDSSDLEILGNIHEEKWIV